MFQKSNYKFRMALFVVAVSYSQFIPTTTAQPQQYPVRGSFLNQPSAQQKPMLPTHYSFFDLELLKYTAQQTNGNFMVSPASIKAAMGMLLEGAMGKCADELRFTLRLPNNQQQIREYFFTFLKSLNISSEGILLETANKVFLNSRYTPDETYQKSLTDYYFANLHQVDFTNAVQTIGIINGWVNFATRGLIPTVVNNGDFDPETVMILANVLYFKGAWETAFEPRYTQHKCFKYQQKCRNVAMMEMENDFKYGVIEELRSQAVEIPYKGGKYTMLILLPKEEDGLSRLENDISFVSIPNILKGMETTEVELSLPKFTIDFSQDLVEILRKTGINEVFAPSANLSGMVISSNPSPQVNNVFHKTRIEVNEQGSEAAAITGAMVIPLMGSSASRMNVNHPFLFFIRDVTTGTILFEGRVNIPDEVPVPPAQRPTPVQRPAQPQQKPISSFVNSNDNTRYSAPTTNRPRTAFDPVNPNTNNEQASYNSQSNIRNQQNSNYQPVREKPTYQPSNIRTQTSNIDVQPLVNRNQPNRYNQGVQPQQDTRTDFLYSSQQQPASPNVGQGSNRNTQVNQLASQSTAIRFEENNKNDNYNSYQGEPISGKQLSAPSKISFARSASSSPSASKHDSSYNSIPSTPSPAYSSSKTNSVNRIIPPVVITLISSQFSNDRYNLQKEASIGNGPQENEAILTNNNLQSLSKSMEVVYQKPLSKDKDAIAFAL